VNTRRQLPRLRDADERQFQQVRDQLRAERRQRERDRLQAAANLDPPDYGPLDLTDDRVQAALAFDHQHGVRHHGLACCDAVQPAGPTW
jgi:hypothetical protein